MRKIIYSVAASLDGYIAGPNGEFDWIPMPEELDFGAFLERFDTLLAGRRSYETIAENPFENMRTIVFSDTLKPEDMTGVTIVPNGDFSIVQEVRESPGKDIWLFGGGVLFRAMLEAGLVDAVEVAIVPMLLGDGLPLLPKTQRRTQLKLTSREEYSNGVLLLKYEVQS